MRGRLRPAVLLGWVLLVVVFAVGVIAYVLGERSKTEQDHRAQVGATLLTAVLIVPPAVKWAWSRRRPPVQAAPTVEQTTAAVQALANRQAATWRRQVQLRGIRLPAPVKVRWRWADLQVAVPRAEVGTTSGAAADPGPLPGLQVGEVLGSGLVTRLHDEVYGRLPYGRLILIGAPGAGKTAAMILLLLAALDHREHLAAEERVKVPVPVWLTLGSWNPAEQKLRAWVIATIARDHPYLRAAVYGPDVIGALFDTGQVALFLDGLDEMSDAHRARAIHRLQTEASGLRVVLTSRPDEYRATLDDGAQLSTTAVIELRPVPVAAAADYLLADRTEPVRRAWTVVTQQIRAHPHSVLAQTLNNPLTLSLARAAHPVDPTPLLDPALDTEPVLRRHLLDQTLVTAYPDPRERARATYWLGWIAHHMNTQPTGPARDLAWWTIPTWTPRWQRQLVSGLVLGLVCWALLADVQGAAVFGVVLGFVAGVGSGFLVRSANEPQTFFLHRPSRKELRSLHGVRLRAVMGIISMLASVLAFGLGMGGGPKGAAMYVLAALFGLVGGVVFGLMDMVSSPVAASAEATPRLTHHQDAQHGLVFGLVFGLAFGLAFGVGLGVGLRFGVGPGVGLGVVFVFGFVFVVVFGLVLGIPGGAGQLLVAEVMLAIKGRRVRFMRFLEAGVDRQVLRQAGAVYQFRHADLQDRLADRFAHLSEQHTARPGGRCPPGHRLRDPFRQGTQPPAPPGPGRG